MREINLDRLRTTLTVARLGSFAAAARALHLAPPTVTLHVAELESRLDTPLLLRGRRRVTPTAATRVFADAVVGKGKGLAAILPAYPWSGNWPDLPTAPQKRRRPMALATVRPQRVAAEPSAPRAVASRTP